MWDALSLRSISSPSVKSNRSTKMEREHTATNEAASLQINKRASGARVCLLWMRIWSLAPGVNENERADGAASFQSVSVCGFCGGCQRRRRGFERICDGWEINGSHYSPYTLVGQRPKEKINPLVNPEGMAWLYPTRKCSTFRYWVARRVYIGAFGS